MTQHVNPAIYRRPRSIPVLVLIDLQQEHVTEGRPLALAHAPAALVACRRAIDHARGTGIPIAYVRWNGLSPFFTSGTRFGRWIEGFEPHGCDMIFERDQPSCFSSTALADTMERSRAPLVLAGFSGDSACIATVIDGFNRGRELTVLADASASHGLDGRSADDIHGAACAIMRNFSDVISTDDWIAATTPARTYSRHV